MPSPVVKESARVMHDLVCERLRGRVHHGSRILLHVWRPTLVQSIFQKDIRIEGQDLPSTQSFDVPAVISHAPELAHSLMIDHLLIWANKPHTMF